MAYRPTVYKTGEEYQKGGKRERGIPLYWIGSRNHVLQTTTILPYQATKYTLVQK